MIRYMVVGLFLSFFAVSVLASDHESKNEQYMEDCKAYAKEEGISAGEMKEYLMECIEGLEEEEKEAKKKD